MPKSMTTILGLALAAVSIGFNAWRYPIVWPAVSKSTELAVKDESPKLTPQPAPPAPVAEKAVVAESPRKPEPAVASPTPAEQDAAKSAAASAPAAIPAPPSKVDAPMEAKPAVAERRAEPSAGDEKRLVPVPKRVLAAKPMGAAEGVTSVRRLPPVDPNVAAPVAGDPSKGIPIYPSTGIE
jgi:hypothetical protein